MRIAICDDDDWSRSYYSDLIKNIAAKRCIQLQISEYENGRQLEFDLDGSSEPPDILLLDVLMPEENGIQVGQRLRLSGYSGIIIYVSQSADFVLPAFDVEAFNYVLKGTEREDSERFKRIFVRAIEKSIRHKKKYILLSGISEHRNLALDSILYFESMRHVITVHYGQDEQFDFISTLSRTEDALAAYGFLRTHRSYLVNSSAIRAFDFKGVKLIDGTELPMGRRHYLEVKQTMRNNAVVNLDG